MTKSRGAYVAMQLEEARQFHMLLVIAMAEVRQLLFILDSIWFFLFGHVGKILRFYLSPTIELLL